MAELHEALATKVDPWRDAGYPSDVPALGEILEFATEGGSDGPSHPRYLRAAQLRALETYWYLRVAERTPSIPELYRRLFPVTSERLTALGLGAPALTALAVEIKMTAKRHDDVEGEKGLKAEAIRALEVANPGRIFFQMVFADMVAPVPDIAAVTDFVDANPSIGW